METTIFYLGFSNNGEENGNHDTPVGVQGSVIMEKKMETTTYSLGFRV